MVTGQDLVHNLVNPRRDPRTYSVPINPPGPWDVPAGIPHSYKLLVPLLRIGERSQLPTRETASFGSVLDNSNHVKLPEDILQYLNARGMQHEIDHWRKKLTELRNSLKRVEYTNGYIIHDIDEDTPANPQDLHKDPQPFSDRINAFFGPIVHSELTPSIVLFYVERNLKTKTLKQFDDWETLFWPPPSLHTDKKKERSIRKNPVRGGSAAEAQDILLEEQVGKDNIQGVGVGFDKGIPKGGARSFQESIHSPSAKAGKRFQSGLSESAGRVQSMPSTTDTHAKRASYSGEERIPLGDSVRKDDEDKLDPKASMPTSLGASGTTDNNGLQNPSSSTHRFQTPPKEARILHPQSANTPLITLETPTMSNNPLLPHRPFHSAPSKVTSSAADPITPKTNFTQASNATWPRANRDMGKGHSGRGREFVAYSSTRASRLSRDDHVFVWRSNYFHRTICVFEDWFRETIIIPYIWIIIAYNIYVALSWGWRLRYGQHEAEVTKLTAIESQNNPQLNAMGVKHFEKSGKLIDKKTLLQMNEWPYISKYEGEREKEREWVEMANMLDALAQEREDMDFNNCPQQIQI